MLSIVRIHEYNTEATIITFIPYHETPLFKTLLSILPPAARLPNNLRFLAPYQTSMTNPPRSAIIHAAVNNRPFLSALNSYVVRVVRAQHQSTPLISFWASMITQAIDGMTGTARSGRNPVQQQREEDLMLFILPVLDEALGFSNCPEIIIACYMTIMVLVAKTNLSEKVLDGLMEAVIRSRNSETETSCLVCVAIIAQERRRARFPKAVTKRILKIRGFVEKLPGLAKQCRVERLALGYILGRLERADGSDFIALQDVETTLKMNLLEDSLNKVAIGALIQFVRKNSNPGETNERTRVQLGTIMSTLASSTTLAVPWREALIDEGVDLETLESQLGIVLQDLILQDGENGVPDQLPAPVKDSSSFETILSSLVEQGEKSASSSFLISNVNTLFGDISRVFAIAARSTDRNERLTTVLSLPILQRDHAFRDPTYLTCLLRLGVATSSSSAKVAAWREVHATLSKVGSADDGTDIVDLQVLIPYVITALGDRSKAVRHAASECVVRLGRLDKTQKDIKKTKKTKIWGQKDVYGGSIKDLEWLSHDESNKVVSTVLIPTLEECLLDEYHIQRVLSSALDGQSQESATGLKSSLRQSLSAFLASHAVKSPLLCVKLVIFGILGRVGKGASSARTQYIIPAIRTWLQLKQSVAAELCYKENLTLNVVDRSLVDCLHARDSEGVQVLLEVMDGEFDTTGREFQTSAVQRLKEIWPELKSGLQEHIATSLLDLALIESEEPAVLSRQEQAFDILRSVTLSTAVLDLFLRSVPTGVQLQVAPPPNKRRRTSQVEKIKMDLSSEADVSKHLRRLTVILELLDSSHPERHPELLKGLFHILGELQHYRNQSGLNLVYLQSLAIGSLLSIVKEQSASKESNIDTSVIRADLLVDCIRHSSSPQVQNSALLLISNLASWQPELVLHSVMPIFTFMGSTLLRQSDDYSLHVIDQTVSRVVPPLAASLRRKNQNFVLGISELLLSFVAAYEHIPLHRRLKLFSQLLKTLGPEGSLAATTALLFDRYSTDLALSHFLADVMKSFDAVVILKSYRQYLDLVEDGLRPRRQVTDALFGFKEKNAVEIEQSLLNLLGGILTMLHDQHLKTKIGKVLYEDQAQATLVRQHFTFVVEKTIILSNLLINRESRKYTPSGKISSLFTRFIVHEACRKVLLATLDLLPSVELVKSSEALLGSPHEQVRRATLQAIQLRVQKSRDMDDVAIRALFALFPRITTILQSSKDMLLRQAAVACIDQISESFGKKDVDGTVEAAGAIAQAECLSGQDEQLSIMSLHCLASMVETLREEFISLLPIVLPQTFEHLRASAASSSKQAIHDASWALVCAIVEHLPFIFSGQYFTQALELSYQSAAAGFGESTEEVRKHFHTLSARLIEAKQLLTAMDQTWRVALISGSQALAECTDLLTMTIRGGAKATIVENKSQLFHIILQAFDFRRVQQADGLHEQYTDTQVEQIEQRVTEAVIAMILKLNDASFRPLFVQLVEWTVKKLPKTDTDGRTLRAISFYRFLCAFFERLKVRFNLYMCCHMC